MNRDFAKMYPTGAVPTLMKPGVKIYSVTGVAETIDLSKDVEDVIVVQTSNALATAVGISGMQAGQTIILEYGGGAVADHAFTFATTFDFNVAGNNVATANADGESLIIQVISPTRGVIVANNNGVALS